MKTVRNMTTVDLEGAQIALFQIYHIEHLCKDLGWKPCGLLMLNIGGVTLLG